MTPTLQLTIDCASSGCMTRFWAMALGYQIEPP